MDYHQMINLYAKATRAERVLDTVFSNTNTWTQPTASPEDVIVTATHQLTTVLKGNSKGNNEELDSLTKVAGSFNEIEKDKAETSNRNKPIGNGIRKHHDKSPRVEES